MLKRLAATAVVAAAGFFALAAPASADTHDVTVTSNSSTSVDAGNLLDLTASVFVRLGLL